MLGAVVISSIRPERRVQAGATPTILHFVPTRSSAVRLAPVAAALDAPQARVDGDGRVVPWPPAEPLSVLPTRVSSTADLSHAVAAALSDVRPDAVLLAGDDDAALVCALAATSAGVPIARLGAGLRCGDRGVKREINRIAIDELATRLYTDGEDADERLRAEGIGEERILRVGSTLAASVARWREPALEHAAWDRLGLRRRGYVVITLHRPESFAEPERLAAAVTALTNRYPVVLCADERLPTAVNDRGHRAAPADYVEMLSLLAGAGAVITDSSCVQEESSVLGVPCFTLARSSERALTLTHGTNALLGDDVADIAEITIVALEDPLEPIPLWDDEAGSRVAVDLLAVPWRSA
jgi:UDP-N-acetylglucosamine 2-epimerase (non-hydrolysing)